MDKYIEYGIFEKDIKKYISDKYNINCAYKKLYYPYFGQLGIDENCVSFCTTKDITTSKAEIIFTNEANAKKYNGKAKLIIVDNPALDFFIMVDLFTSDEPSLQEKINDTIFIGNDAYIGANGNIGYGCYINNATIGNNVRIGPNTVIGTSGFGHIFYNGRWLSVPHIGTVEIQDNVEIGANVCIDRGCLYKTIIGEGTVIDNLVHIPHNVIIGKNCRITAGAVIGGSTIIEDNTYIGINSTLRDRIYIGKNTTIGMGAVVTKSFPDNVTIIGNPAKILEKK